MNFEWTSCFFIKQNHKNYFLSKVAYVAQISVGGFLFLY